MKEILDWLAAHTVLAAVPEDVWAEWRESRTTETWAEPTWWWEHSIIAYAPVENALLLRALPDGATLPADMAALLGLSAGDGVAPVAPDPVPERPTVAPVLFVNGRSEKFHNDRVTRNLAAGVRGVAPYIPDTDGRYVATVTEQGLDVYTIAQSKQAQEVFKAVVAHYGELAADLLRLVLRLYEEAASSARDEDGYVSIPITAFCAARGIEPMWRVGPNGARHEVGYRQADKLLVAAALRHLTCFRVEVQDRKSDGYYIRETAVLHTDILKTPEGSIPERVEVRPGRWLDEATQHNRGLQYVELDQWLFRRHVHQERWPKRIGLYVAEQLRIDKRETLRRSVHEILEATGLLPDHNPRRPTETRTRFEEALDANRAYGTTIADWDYERSQKGVKPTGYRWFARWLQDKVIITASDATAEANRTRRLRAAAHSAATAPTGPPRRGRGRPRKTPKAP
jgi:hypothetical protein